MKKVLFATSALVLSAGFASAEVALSGDGRMGVVYDGNDAQFGSRARVKFTLTGESDAGLSFGAAFRVDQENYNANRFRSAARGTAGAVWISGTYGKLSMGDTLSASEAAIGDLYEIGYTDGTFVGDVEEISYLTGDGENTDQGPNILYEYSINNFNLFLSASDASDNDWPGATGSDNPYYDEEDDAFDPADNDTDTDVAWSVAGSYNGELANGSWMVGLGYAKHDDAKEITLGGEFKTGGFSVKGIIVDYDERGEFTLQIDDAPDFTLALADYEYDRTYGLSMAYEYQAWTFEGFWRRDEFEAITAGFDDEDFDTFGIGAEYDLGGGAVLAGAIADSDYASDTVADFGIKFKF